MTNEEITASYATSGGADSGDIAQHHTKHYKAVKDPQERKRKKFKEFLKMTEKPEKKKDNLKEYQAVRCIMCDDIYGEKQGGGTSHGICSDCFKKRTGKTIEEARRK